MDHTSNIDRLDETAIHDWYRHVYAYSDRIIDILARKWELDDQSLILDPFNGTGTTTVAAKQRGIDAIGTDINPVGVLAGKAKTTWDIDIEEFQQRKEFLLKTVEPALRQIDGRGRTTLDSFNQSIPRKTDLSKYNFERSEKEPTGWLSDKAHQKMCVLQHHINEQPNDSIRNLFELAMVAILPESVADVGFGPEAYRLSPTEHVDVYRIYIEKISNIEYDLKHIQRAISNGKITPGRTEILQADARFIDEPLQQKSSLLKEHNGIDAVITSPPYPAEHDYTRNQRLELVWMGEIWDNDDLRELKRQSIRSHTKNIYVDDDAGDRLNVRGNNRINTIVTQLESKLAEVDNPSGFEQTYPRVIEEYYAGMQQHFDSIYNVLKPGGLCGYVVADQQSYWNVKIETATILGEIASNRIGFNVNEVVQWRNLHPTTGEADELAEEILILQKPEK